MAQLSGPFWVPRHCARTVWALVIDSLLQYRLWVALALVSSGMLCAFRQTDMLSAKQQGEAVLCQQQSERVEYLFFPLSDTIWEPWCTYAVMCSHGCFYEYMRVCVGSLWFSGFLPPSKHMHVRLTGDSKLTLGVCVVVGLCVALWWTGDLSKCTPPLTQWQLG